MSDIDTYLAELRSQLSDLAPKRADEIVAEARTHLESRAAQLRAAGAGEDEAIGEALSAFGDPARMAQHLVDKNSRHRRPVALRAVGALVIAFGSILALMWLLGIAVALSRTGTITLPAGLDLESTARIVHWVGYCCIALLTGVVGGRRFWWIAGLPGLAMFGWGTYVFSVIPPTVRTESDLSLLRTLVSGAAFTAMMAGLGWLGSRLPRGRRVSVAITTIPASVVGLIWLGFVVFVVAASIKTEGAAPWYFGILLATVIPAVGALLIAGRRDRFLSREAFIALVSTVCGLGLLSAIGIALIFAAEGPGALRYAQPWITIAALACGLGLLGALIYWRRSQPDPTPGHTNPPPG